MVEIVGAEAAAHRWALKEWGGVCAALAAGRRTLLLRKGGIADVGGEFRPERRSCWLLRTTFHQARERMASDIQDLVGAAEANQPPAGRLLIAEFAVVDEVAFIADEAALAALAPFQCLTAAALGERFHYRRRGLWALTLRVYRRTEPCEIVETAEIAGCKSWAPLAADLPVTELTPAMDDREFARQVQAIRAASKAD